MTALALAATSAGQLFAASVFALCAQRTHRARTHPGTRLARNALAAWWALLALSAATVAARNALALSDRTWLPLHLALLDVFLLAHAAALAALATYLLAAYTGEMRVRVSVIVAFAAYAAAFTTLLFYARPTGVYAGAVRAEFRYAQPVMGLAMLAEPVALYGPDVACAIAYGALALRLADTTQRYRVALAAASILAWAVAGMAGLWAASAQAEPALSAAQAGWPLAAALALLAIAPPRWVRRRYGVASLAEMGV